MLQNNSYLCGESKLFKRKGFIQTQKGSFQVNSEQFFVPRSGNLRHFSGPMSSVADPSLLG